MTLDELITKLTELRDQEEISGDSLVLFAHQPHYPLQCGILGPVVHGENAEEIEEMERSVRVGHFSDDELPEALGELERMKKERPIVYLLEGSSRPWNGDQELSPYASRSLWDL